ncbi:MAG: 8-oxoguanine deaminase [Candidatus Eisenbacteria bacterium]|nr:8-oxoguanine deaminase [Candidatus Eisenbacteria bacterium]
MRPVIIANADALVTMESRHVIRSGYVVLEGSQVHSIGEGAPPALPDALTVDASGCVVTPGLVNTHHHFYQTLTRAYPPSVDATLFPWLRALYPVWEGITAHSVRLGTALAMAELFLSGCTTTSDHHYVFPCDAEPRLIDAQIEVAKNLGMRFVATRGSMSLGTRAGGLPPDSVVQDEAVILADCRRVVEDYHDPDPFGMVQVALAPCSPFSVTPRLMEATATLAAELGVRLHTHLAETKDEQDYCRRHYGCTPLELLHRTGWLSPRTWLAHGIHFSDAEIRTLGDAGVGIAHCPTSNMRLASGIARVPALRAARCPVGLGVDGSASNDSSHLLLEMRQALLLGRLGAGADGFSAWDALELATVEGARCLGRERALGRLTPGFAADVAVFEITDVAHSGAMDPVAGLILCAPAQVRHLFVAGRHVVCEGRISGLDVGSLCAEHRAESLRLRRRVATHAR